jgi:hypothetical protein
VTPLLIGALTWEPNIKGGLYVLISVVILCGSAQLLLSTNVGSRLGFQLAAAGLFGFLTLIGIMWWVYGIGPQGPAPTWKPEGVTQGAPAESPLEATSDFPRDWRKLELTDAAVADAQPVADTALTEGDEGVFSESSEYVVIGAYKKGGKDYGPFGLNFRPFDVFHTPHYMLIQVQPVLKQEPVPGQPPPRPQPDPAAEPVSAVLLRDLGAKRLHPAVFTIASALIFGLLAYQLHTRDKELLAARS